jgi:hypothetical protein
MVFLKIMHPLSQMYHFDILQILSVPDYVGAGISIYLNIMLGMERNTYHCA